ncbi:hypothetical protein HIR79_12060 [Halomonas sp. PGE1]|nr:hypothetical protein HIR79_12060 [Halomonas sp. PGE1]
MRGRGRQELLPAGKAVYANRAHEKTPC